MDTQKPQPSKLPPLRTYAKDLESKRKEKGLTPETEAVITVNEDPAPKESFLTKKPKVVSMPPIIASPSVAREGRRAPLPGSIKKITSANASSSNTTFIVDNEDAAAATIITDTKRDRFKLLPAIVTSIKQWFADKKLSYQVKKQPKYTIPETSRRKGVIQKATSATGKLATSDFSSIHERIRQRQEEAEKEPSHTSWSAKTEPGFLLLETSKKAAISNVQFVSRKSYRTSPEEIVVKKDVQRVSVVTPPLVVKPEVPLIATEPEVTVEPEPIIEVVAPAPIIENVTEPEPVTMREKVSRLSTILHIDTNTLALGVSAAVLALVVLGTYGYFMLNGLEEDTNTTLSARELTPLINSDRKEVPLTTINRESVFEALVDIRSSLEATTQIVFVTEQNELIPPHLLLSLLGVSLEQSFAQGISQVRFGYTSERQPFMLLQVTDLVTAKGGLLAWEETMGADINTLYGITGAELQPKFIDASLGGLDVRVLKTESGTERLLYGVHGNLVFIATNSADFTELLNLRTP